jgi:hypothetical protein
MRRIHRRVHLNVLYVTVRSVRLGDHEPPGDHMGSKSNNSHTRPIADPFGVQGGVTIRTRSQPESNSMISIVHPAELSSETQQTPGSLRMSAMRQCKASSPHYGRAYLWLSLQRRPASTTMASRTPPFTSLRERLPCDGATSRNTSSLLVLAIFFMYQVGCRIRNSTLRRKIHFDGWLYEVRQSQSL